MTFLKRIGLFLLVNMLVVTTISIFLNVVLPLFGIQVDPASTAGLLVFCSVWGFGGALISLMMSKSMAKWSMGVQVIDPQTSDPQARWLIETVHRLAQKAGIQNMPEVGIYDSMELNAFATGPSKNNALVAVSRGLLTNMNESEVEGVLGHELTHVTNGDMVTMTLITGVVNSFVLFLSRIIARIVASSVDEKNAYVVQMLMTIVLDISLSLLGSFVVAYFSRIREYRADQGGARLAGRDRMIAGLRKLQAYYERLEPDSTSMATLKISSRPTGLMALLASHPSLDERIRRLQLLPPA